MPNDETIVTPPVGDDDNNPGVDATGDTGDDGQDNPEDVDWKAKFEESEGLRRRAVKDLDKYKNSDPAPNKAPSKSSDLDYGQKAFLIANGVKGTEEIDLVKTVMANTGKSLDDVLESKYFQAELKEMRDAKTFQDAVPDGSKRSNQSASSTVEYWIAKGELPPASERELRKEVVNARLKSDTNKNQFTDTPVVRQLDDYKSLNLT